MKFVTLVFSFFLAHYGLAGLISTNGVSWYCSADRNTMALGAEYESLAMDENYGYYRDKMLKPYSYRAISPDFEGVVELPSVLNSLPVTTIQAYAFKTCSQITKVVVPDSITLIRERAFYKCNNLQEVVFLGDAPDLGNEVFYGTPKTLKIKVRKGSIGWNSGSSMILPSEWGGRGISYMNDGESDSTLNSMGVELAHISYSLTNNVLDRTIANIEIGGDTSIDSFVLKDGKVYDCAVRIVNISDKDVNVTLPDDFVYEKFLNTSPLKIPASSTNILTITRTKADTFLLSREELVLEVQE